MRLITLVFFLLSSYAFAQGQVLGPIIGIVSSPKLLSDGTIDMRRISGEDLSHYSIERKEKEESYVYRDPSSTQISSTFKKTNDDGSNTISFIEGYKKEGNEPFPTQNTYKIKDGKVLEAIFCVQSSSCAVVNEKICLEANKPIGQASNEKIKQESVETLERLISNKVNQAVSQLSFTESYKSGFGEDGNHIGKSIFDIKKLCSSAKIKTEENSAAVRGPQSGAVSQ